MYYRLPDNIALRRWPDLGYAYYSRGLSYAVSLTAEEAHVMLLSDGEHDIEATDTVMLLILKNLIMPCNQGERNSEWSAFREYDNRYFPMMNLMITGKCNFNCLHCFNAADNSALMTEWEFGDICELLNQARDCGITGFQITGGEPMMHKNFLDIIREIYKRNMSVFTITTNGYFINQNILNEIKAMGCNSQIRISFDGIGAHDWLRGFKGAEARTLGAIKLCIDNGFQIMINTQVHKKNLDTMLKTAKLLNDMGVSSMRIIRTTEVPRWVENAPNTSLSIQEYYESMLELAREYCKLDFSMNLTVWQYLSVLPKEKEKEKRFSAIPVKFPDGTYSDNQCCCYSACSMTAVTSSGEVVPCNQASGHFMKHGISLGNLHDTPLREILKGSRYLELAKMTVGDIRRKGGKCSKCKHFTLCGGGCRALGMLFTGGGAEGWVNEDITKCYFFENGWRERIVSSD